MRGYIRNDDIVFTGNDAVEYMNICDGVTNNNENRISFQNYMSEHTKTRYDLNTGDVYLDCDFLDLDGLSTIMIDCDIEHIEATDEFTGSIEKNQEIHASFKYEENVEYIENDNFVDYYDEQYCINDSIIEIEAAWGVRNETKYI